MKTTQRIDKILATCGFGTRKEAKNLLHTGTVTVDGKVVTVADTQVDPNVQEIAVDGEVLNIRHHVYLMLNKPANVVSSTKDGEHQTVLDLLDKEYNHRFPGGEIHMVGRLDIDTEGLLLLTTDGSLTHRLTSPKNHISKKYFVRLKEGVSPAEAENYKEKFGAGIEVPRESSEEAFVAKPAELEWLNPEESSVAEAYLTIYEGKYHQVKRMFAAMGNEVIYLKRVAVGELQLDPNLASGAARELTAEELELLK